jgi:carboxypeptidase PM20D1
MKAIRNIVLLALAAMIVLVAVVVGRTLTVKQPGQAAYGPVPAAPAIDAGLAAQHLSAAVKFQTISHEDPAEDDPKPLAAQRDWLAATYPRFAAASTREIVGGGALIWTWKGSDPALAPIVLMAHQDVVPVVEETRNLWTADPFGGEIRGGAVWGRGSVDDKGSLVALMEAAEALAAEGFTPKRTIYIVSGHDEEVRGSGARAAAQALEARGVHALFALDEGSVVVSDFPLTHKPAALIGISEKGYATLKITARGAGGHASAPPDDTAATTVARAVAAIADHPFPLKFAGPAADMLRSMAPNLGFTARMAIANGWLFGAVLTKQMGATPVGKSMLHTTIAPTRLSGSPKDNVLPSLATAEINYRIAPGQTAADVMARAKAAVGKLPVELSWAGEPRDPSPVSSTTSDGWRDVAGVTKALFAGVPVAPSLVTAGTDGRSMSVVTGDVYRFQPILLGLHDIEMIHGVNEHLKIEDLKRMADFYARLMLKSAG